MPSIRARRGAKCKHMRAAGRAIHWERRARRVTKEKCTWFMAGHDRLTGLPTLTDVVPDQIVRVFFVFFLYSLSEVRHLLGSE